MRESGTSFAAYEQGQNEKKNAMDMKTCRSEVLTFLLSSCTTSLTTSPQWGAAEAEIKVPPGENTELQVLPLKPGVGQYIAIRATLTARDFFLAFFYPSGSFTCIFPKPLPIFPVLAVAYT